MFITYLARPRGAVLNILVGKEKIATQDQTKSKI